MVGGAINRDPTFDITKAFLMYFVICGHLQAANIISAPQVPLPSWYGAMVVGVSMPCFFAISGFFAHKTFEECDWVKIIARSLSFVWPIISFGVVFGLCSAIHTSRLSMILKQPLWLWGSLWFLRTLVIVYIITAAVFAISRRCVARLFMFAFVYFGLVFLPHGFPCYIYLKDVMHMFPYFLFGVFALHVFLARENRKLAVACGMFFMAVALTEGRVTENGMGFYWVDSHWRTMLCTTKGVVCFIGRTAMGIAGTISLIWLFRGILKIMPSLAKLQCFGTTTLGVYVIHQWILARIGQCGGVFPLSSSWRWSVGLIVFIACHVFVTVVNSIPAVKVALFVNEKWIKQFLLPSKG